MGAPSEELLETACSEINRIETDAADWADPVLRSTCCESRVGVVPSTLGAAADGKPAAEASPEGEPSGWLSVRARVGAAGGQVAAGVQAAAKTAGALRPRAECGRCWL